MAEIFNPRMQDYFNKFSEFAYKPPTAATGEVQPVKKGWISTCMVGDQG